MRGVLFASALMLLSSPNVAFADDLKFHGSIYPVIGNCSAEEKGNCDTQERRCHASCRPWYVSRCHVICCFQMNSCWQSIGCGPSDIRCDVM